MMLEGISLIVVYVILCLCGVLLHFLLKMKAIKDTTGKRLTLKGYYKEHPYTTSISIISCIVSFLILFATGQMNLALAFGVGYLCDSVANNIAKKAIQRVE